MKDRSRFMSSLIVSLFAGFIYFLFGQDINENVQNTIKQAFSSADIEEDYLSTDCFSFNSITDNSSAEVKKKSSKFYIKRKTIEFKDKGESIPVNELLSEYVNTQAKLQRAVPDKNIDFTAELDLLIKEKSDSDMKPYKELSNLLSKSTDNEVADTRNTESRKERLNKIFNKTQIKTYIVYKKGDADFNGNGFEYNYVTGEYSNDYKVNAPKVKANAESNGKNNNSECSTNCNNKCNKDKKKEKKTKTRKIQINQNEDNIIINDSENDVIEINIYEDSDIESSM